MTLPPDSLWQQLQQLHAVNAHWQPIEFLQSIRPYQPSPPTQSTQTTVQWEIDQGEHHIRALATESHQVLLLWSPEYEVALDDVHPQWDVPSDVAHLLEHQHAERLQFPSACLLWDAHQHEWITPWLATNWWPEKGITDAIDQPQAWLVWWWTQVMQEPADTCPSWPIDHPTIT